MGLDDLTLKHCYFVLARKSAEDDYLFAVNDYNSPLANQAPVPMTNEEAASTIDLLKLEGYETIKVRYIPHMPGGVVNAGALAIKNLTPELIALGDKFMKASKK
jgi:hypothetical protein